MLGKSICIVIIRDGLQTSKCVFLSVMRRVVHYYTGSYFSNVVWAYDTPKPDAEKIRERFAFYRNKGVTLA